MQYCAFVVILANNLKNFLIEHYTMKTSFVTKSYSTELWIDSRSKIIHNIYIYTNKFLYLFFPIYL